jgi:ankyrin repeat protein
VLVALALTGHVSCAGTTETGNVLREIHDAARDGDFGKVQTLVKGNPGLVFNKDKGGFTPLHWAASSGHKDVAELLLAHGADVNAKNNNDWTPLYYAVSGGHKDVAQLLRQHGGD